MEKEAKFKKRLKRFSVECPSKKSDESKINIILAQCCAVSGPNLLLISFGMTMGFLTILIPALYGEDAEIVVTKNELSWISSINYFVFPVGALVADPLSDRLGRKPVMHLAAVFFLSGWLLLHLGTHSVGALMLAFTVLGFAYGVANPPAHIYIAEVTEVRYRGVLLATLAVSYKVGIFLQLIIGRYLHWRACALVNATFSLLTLVAVFVAPESPQWLTNQGRLPETERSLRWLRGWTDSSSIKLEFDSLVLQSSSSGTSAQALPRPSVARRLLRREVVLAFLLVTFIFFVSCFNGGNTLLTYSGPVLQKIEAPIAKYDPSIVLGVLQVIAPTSLILMIKRTGKKLPTLGSLLISAFALLGVAVYVYLREDKGVQEGSDGSWIPMALMLLAIFVSDAGIFCTPWIVASEVFPVDVRGLVISILGSISSIFSALANKSLLYMLDGLTLPGTFAFYAAVNFLGLVVLYWAMPETEGKTSAEIQQFFQKESKVPSIKGT